MLKKRYPYVMQEESSDCAAAAVGTILKKYKSEYTILKLREILGTDSSGTTVKGIVNGLEKLNFISAALKTDIDNITNDITLPAIARVKLLNIGYHYVVIYKVDTRKRQFIIADPSRGICKENFDDFKEKYTGILILMVPKSNYEVKKEKAKGLADIFISLIMPQKKLILLSILSSIVLTIFGLFLGTLSKIIVDEIIPNQLTNKILIFGLIFSSCEVFKTILEGFRQHIILFLSRKIDIPVILGYFEHIIHLPYEFFVNRSTGDIITRFQDASTIKEIFTAASISLILDIMLSLISALLLWNIKSQLFFIFFIMLILDIIIVYILKKPYKDINMKKMEASSDLSSNIIESLENYEMVKAYNCENKRLEYIENKLVKLLKIGYKEGKIQIFHNSLSNLIISIGNIIFLLFGAYFIINKEMTLGDLLLFQTLSGYFTNPIHNLVSFQISFQEAQIAIKRLNELTQIKKETDEETYINTISLKHDIEFKDITFAYGSRPPVFKNFSLKIKEGEKLGIIGESGTGKSTLARLLLRFVNCSNGEIFINNISIKDIEVNLLREKIAYIPQNTQLFKGSILENLKLGNEKCNFEDIIKVMEILNLKDYIDNLPLRYNTLIEENGANLSGGERQRIVIARALLRDPDIIIFDEATSNLDAFNERFIHDLIYKKLKNKTIIIIAHRLSSIINCDNIVIIDKGKILSSGTHLQLLSKNEKYKQMVNLQKIELERNVQLK